MSQFDVFEDHDYLSIKTFRANDEGVPTAVWFYKDGENIYITTGMASGKVKRIGGNEHVEVAPCDVRGGLLGEFVVATAEILQAPEDRAHAHDLLAKKYGHTEMWSQSLNDAQDPARAYLRVVPR
ncbi:MAG: PPOX class F420-dependent oxidoreductase [Aggregatilineales bacterium]